MQLPSITGFYLAILALLYIVLGLQVSRLRRGNGSLFGDGDNIKLRSAIRAHANFVGICPDHRADGRAAGDVRHAGAAGAPPDGARCCWRGCCIRSACMSGREPGNFRSAGSAASSSPCWSCSAPPCAAGAILAGARLSRHDAVNLLQYVTISSALTLF